MSSKLDILQLTRQLIEQITVFEYKLQVSFKPGVDIEVEIYVNMG